MHDPVYTHNHYVLNLFLYYNNIVHKTENIKKEFILILNYMYTVTFRIFFTLCDTILQKPNV